MEKTTSNDTLKDKLWELYQGKMTKKWFEFLFPFLSSPEMGRIYKQLGEIKKDGVNILPSQENIFRAFNYKDPEDIKVIILGQDPYPDPKNAVGLAFSAHKDSKIPASLRNIFKEVQDDVYSKNVYADLEHWANQGVLLLNTALTVEEKTPGSHIDIWEKFTNYVLRKFSIEYTHRVYMLWGKEAKKYKAILNANNLFLEAAHPSPLNVNGGFLGCKHFSRANAYITNPYINEKQETHHRSAINW